MNVTDTESPSISVQGANRYRITTGSCLPFVDPGATAFDGCAGAKPVTSSVSGPGGATSVNNAVPGTYTVHYTATDGTHEATATRTVIVGNFTADESDQPDTGNTPPTITLNGDDQITIECGTAFTDPGATAAVCGGSVPVTTSGTVDIHTPGNYTITYTATANSLTSTATRVVTVSPDNSAPTIQVLGANPMTVECHASFTDPGATAHDACAGDFAATASGTVDPNTVGVYVITYNATDPSGFVATPATRTVYVVDTTNPVVIPPASTPRSGSASGSSRIGCRSKDSEHALALLDEVIEVATRIGDPMAVAATTGGKGDIARPTRGMANSPPRTLTPPNRTYNSAISTAAGAAIWLRSRSSE